MPYPSLEISLSKIAGNASAILEICASHGITVCAVVKSVCGYSEIARAILSCNAITQLGDSRIANIERLRQNGVNADFMMLRIPMLSQCEAVASFCDYSLNSEMPVIAALGKEAAKIKRIHKIILMIDVGDLREGILPEDAPCIAEQITELPGVELAGIGANLSCYGGIRPTEKNMPLLVECAENIEKRLGRKLEIISGGNSSSLPLLMSGKMPLRINHLRIGEGMLLGRDTMEGNCLPGTSQDAFVFKAEVIEAGRKPSAPIGEIVRDAFGKHPEFEDRGIRRRAILGAGRQDITPEGLKPVISEARILGASSDHLLLDIEDCKESVNTGDILSFELEYSALLSAMTSAYVYKEFVNTSVIKNIKSGVRIILAPTSVGANTSGPESAPEALLRSGLADNIKAMGLETEIAGNGIDEKAVFEKGRPLTEKIELANSINRLISSEVGRAFSENKFPVLIGGDHTVTIAAATEAAKSSSENTEVGMIVFGAFANFNSIEISESKNLHGLTIDACTSTESSLYIGDGRVIPQENVVLIGVRDLDARERERLQHSRFNIFTMEKIDYLGIREAMNQALGCLKHCRNGIHVSFSLDVLSPEYAPGVSLPVDGGLNIRESHLALEMIHKSNLVSSFDFVEYNPEYDKNNITAKLAVNLICTLLGKSIL